MKTVPKPFPSRRLSKTKFFYWEPTAANKPTIYLATEPEQQERREVGRQGGREELASSLPPTLCIVERTSAPLSGKVIVRAQGLRGSAQATCKASVCSWLLELGWGPHCPVGHCTAWALLGSWHRWPLPVSFPHLASRALPMPNIPTFAS